MLTKLRIKELKFLALETMVHRDHLRELKAEIGNPIVKRLYDAVLPVYNAQRSGQLIKGEGQAARIQTSKIEKEIAEAREVVRVVDVSGYI